MSWGPVRPGALDAAEQEPGPRLQRAEHGFLRGSGLPHRWCQRRHFVVLETAFGLGHNFLATWAAWRRDPMRSDHLFYLAAEPSPVPRAQLARQHAGLPWPELAQALQAQWPPCTPDIHVLTFEGGRVHLFLALGGLDQVLRDWVAQVDAFYLDGPALENGTDASPWLQSLGRLAAPGGTLVAATHSPALLEKLTRLGFALQTQTNGSTGLAGMAVLHHQPRHAAAPPPGRRPLVGARRVAVVGAGLAGSAAAAALARLGWEAVVVEANAPASGASGNPAGLIHPVLHATDTLHARWFRACALRALPKSQAGPGLLRLETRWALPQMQALLAAQGLPAEFARALGADEASALAGVRLKHPAWWFSSGGQASPVERVENSLATPGVALLRAPAGRVRASAKGWPWEVLDAQDRPLVQADAVVLANGAGGLGLLGRAAWPQQLWRGQVTWVPEAVQRGLALPALPVGGQGYALAWGDALLCGATQQLDDPDPSVRRADHAHNLQRAASLLGLTPEHAALALPACEGRTQWRVAVNGRLPVIGPVPAEPAETALDQRRSDSPRLWPRQPGLFVLNALGSRGLTQAPLAGEVLAAWMTGTPQPVPARLLDAVDVARFAARTPGQA